jgi:succinoglycan biosynthesis transport protein ExoP
MELNMNEAATMTLVDYWNIAVRRKWFILGCLLLSLGVSGVLCMVLPKSYRSSTLILVEDQKIPEEYVKAIVGGGIEERLTMIQQQVMSRTLLSRVIEEFKLYQSEVRQYGLETVIEDMRKDIKVQTVGTAGPRGKSVEAFSISFAHESPMIAMKVTAKLTSQFIEENLKVREQLVEGATEFLEQELRLAQDRLEQQEQLISGFKTKYMGELPQQTDANLHALDRLQADLIAVTENIHRLTDRLNMIQNSIREYQATGATTAGSTTGVGGPAAIDPLVARLRELERNLATLSAEYKETYPDIVQAKEEMKEIVAQLAKKYGVKPEGTGAGAVQRFDPYLQSLLKEGDEAKIELSSLKERQRRLSSQLKDYESRVERTPVREQELMTLVRDYDNMQKNYQSLLDKKLNARVAENLEKRQKGEQFRVIDPANLPEKTEKPNRLRIMLIGLVFGCGLGMGGAVALEHLKPSFRRPEEIEMALGLPVFAATSDFRMAYPKGTDLTQVLHEGEKAVMKPGTTAGNGDGKPGKNGAAERLSPSHNLVTKWRPLSMVSEQFRVAATRLALMVADRPHTVIVVTSAVKGEGKSSTAVNLGYVLAQDLGKSTVLIDGDLKNPTLHSYVAVASEPGLTDLLLGTQPLDCCVQPLGELPLWIIPTGHRVDRPLELSKIRQLAGVLSELRTRYDYLIVDAPPILPVADMNVLAGMADLLVLVVRAGSTPRDAVQQSLNTLKAVGQVGVILTCVQTEGMPYYMRSYPYAQEEK